MHMQRREAKGRMGSDKRRRRLQQTTRIQATAVGDQQLIAAQLLQTTEPWGPE